MNAIFGYGSLISPLSLAGRCVDYTNIDKRYDNDKRLTDYHDRSTAIDAWNELKQDGVEMHFATLHGYKRYYSIKHRDGGMLEIYSDEHSHDPDTTGVINGTLFTNIPDHIYEAVNDSEQAYEADVISLDAFNYPYSRPVNLDGTTTLYVAQNNRNTNVRRHPVYHDGILRAYIYLIRDEETVTADNAIDHLRTFLKHTYEYDGSQWQSLYALDGDTDVERVIDAANDNKKLYR